MGNLFLYFFFNNIDVCAWHIYIRIIVHKVSEGEEWSFTDETRRSRYWKTLLNQEESLKFYGLVVSSYGKVDS